MTGVLNTWNKICDKTKYCYFLKLVVYSDECDNDNNIYCQTSIF